ncbi:hypothetical protein P691DRAFT_766297 [Macrolepiota fuliginosa MF-IS2]|uniref:Uncharacterized protein n=1 Tax=Macrolepiota fuliginosa MF-IS2 TaxID=1400762 RepID=A0A9P5X0X4_9AGAR|nr:hypothetical protein P691DRAFT_766297 [Macrolepiota fuliginosa MF-IS2]
MVQAQANILQVKSVWLTNPMMPSNQWNSTMIYATQPETQDEQELACLDTIILANIKQQQDVCKHIGNAGKAKNVPTGNMWPSNEHQSTSKNPATQAAPSRQTYPPQNLVPNPTQQQQYQFALPIEDPKAIQNVVQHSLDGMVTLTQRELYTITPNIRKHIKEQVMLNRKW